MKKIIPLLSFSLIFSCTVITPEEKDLKGNWINESLKLRTEFKFLDNNACEFSSDSKIANTGVKIPCHYTIHDQYVEIYQTDQNSGTGNKILVLEYDSLGDSLLLKKTEKDNKPVIFRKNK